MNTKLIQWTLRPMTQYLVLLVSGLLIFGFATPVLAQDYFMDTITITEENIQALGQWGLASGNLRILSISDFQAGESLTLGHDDGPMEALPMMPIQPNARSGMAAQVAEQSMNLTHRLGRAWMVGETGDVGEVEFFVQVPDLLWQDVFLLIDRDGDGDFTTGNIEMIEGTSIYGTPEVALTANLMDGDIFTLGTTNGIGEELTFYVSAEWTECFGMVVAPCPQVSTESPNGPWEGLHEWVRGFNPVEGTAYEIRVLKEYHLTVPADASSVKYTLIEIISSVEIPVERGHITIVKETIGADGEFFYSHTPPITPGIQQASMLALQTSNFVGELTLHDLKLGVHTISEIVPPDWTLMDISCTGANESTVMIGADDLFTLGDVGVSIDLAANEHVICTFTNFSENDIPPPIGLGTITIIKETINADGTFHYMHIPPTMIDVVAPDLPLMPPSLTIDTVNNFGELVLAGLMPGLHTIGETMQSGWELTDIHCEGAVETMVTIGTDTADSDPAFVTGDRNVSINLAPDEHVICTFTNTYSETTPPNGTASITIIKETIGSDGAFQYMHIPPTISSVGGIAPPLFTIETQGFSGMVHLPNLEPGPHTLIELDQPGWALVDIVCMGMANDPAPMEDHTLFREQLYDVTIELLPDEHVTCVFVNLNLDEQPASADDPDRDGIPTEQEDYDGDGDPENDDTDGDGTPDYLDFDDDDDDIPTYDEAYEDLDDDGVPDHIDFIGTFTLINEALGDDDEFVFDVILGAPSILPLTTVNGMAMHVFNVIPGLDIQDFEITEMPLNGWKLVDIQCMGDIKTDIQITDNRVRIAELFPGEDITCIFLNMPDDMLQVGQTVTYFVGPHRVPCLGLIMTECLLVRDDPNEEWRPFYDEIEGFIHQEGVEYELLVLEEPQDTGGPADLGNIQYTLVEIVSSTDFTIGPPDTGTGNITLVQETIGSDGVFQYMHITPQPYIHPYIDPTIDMPQEMPIEMPLDMPIGGAFIMPDELDLIEFMPELIAIETENLSGTYSLSDLVAGPHDIVVLPQPDWELIDIDCTGAVNSQIMIGGANAFSPGIQDVSITLADNEDIVCTFVSKDLSQRPIRPDDADRDGVPDAREDVNGDGDLSNDDTDGDRTPDYLDFDDDNDGIPTRQERRKDRDHDGVPDYRDFMGTLTLIKESIGADDEFMFPYVLGAPGVLPLTTEGGFAMHVFDVTPGLAIQDIEISEMPKEGWYLEDIYCMGGRHTEIKITQDRVYIENLFPGEDITCVFVNVQEGHLAEAQISTYFVAPYRVPCQSADPMGCLQVRQNPNEPWELFYDEILGFNHREGFAYELRVLEEPWLGAPADAANIFYSLIEVVDRENTMRRDSDGDGTLDAIEAAGNRDGNGDGQPDWEQSNVATTRNGTGNGNITLEVSGGCHTIENLAANSEGNIDNTPPDGAFNFPFGIASYNLICDEPGQSATIHYYLQDVLEIDDLTLRKYGPSIPGNMNTAEWYDYPATFEVVQVPVGENGEMESVLRATLVLTDGMLGDDTGFDGLIVDPVGIAQDGEYEIRKTLNTPEPLQIGQPISFTISITNTGVVTITKLPMTDTYDVNYISYDIFNDGTAPDEPFDDGILNWSDLTLTEGDLAPGDTINIVVDFFAVGETLSLAPQAGCVNGAETCNIVTVDGAESEGGVPISSATASEDIRIQTEYKSTLGDYVWLDSNGNGTKDESLSTAGINGVIVNLYMDGLNGNPADGAIQPGELLTTTTTANEPASAGGDDTAAGEPGFYDFPIANNHTYMVEIDPSNFGPGGALEGLVYTGEEAGLDYNGTDPRVVGIGPDPIDYNDADFPYWQPAASVTLEKSTNGPDQAATDADVAPGPMIAPGDTVTWTYQITNDGDVDLLLNGLYDDQLGDISSATCMPVGIGSVLTTTASTTCTMTGIALAGQYSNTAVISGTPTSGPITPVTSTDPSHYFGPELDLALDKKLATGQSNTIMPGDDVTYTITIYNQGNVSATDIIVADYIPAGFTVSGNDSNGWNGTSGIVSATVAGPLLVGATTTLDIVLAAAASANGIYTNTAEIADYITAVKDGNGDNLPDVDSTSDSTNDETPVRDDVIDEDAKTFPGVDDEDDHDIAPVTVVNAPILDLALVKVVDAAPVQVGDLVTFTIYVKNQGTEDATNVEICDWPGAGFVAPTASDNPGWNLGASYPIYTIPDLDAGQTVSFTIAMAVDTDADSSNLTNDAGIRQVDPDSGGTDVMTDEDGTFTGPSPAPPTTDVIDQLDPSDVDIDVVAGDDDDHDIAVVTLAGTPMLQVDKRLNGANPFGVGETISFTIRITNTGSLTITTLPLEDRYNNVFITYQSANITPTTSSGGLLAWNDLLSTDPDGLLAGESMSIDVFFTTVEDTTAVAAAPPCSPDGHTPNVASVENAMADGTPVVTDDDDEDCDHVQIQKPTAVELVNDSIQQTSEGVVVQWHTVTENDLVGFHILKSVGADRFQRTNEMILAENAGQNSGASYEWLDAEATLSTDGTYLLELVYADGSTEQREINMVIEQRSWVNYLPLIAK